MSATMKGRRIRATVSVAGTIETVPDRDVTLAQIQEGLGDELRRLLQDEGFQDDAELDVVTTLDVTVTAEEVTA